LAGGELTVCVDAEVEPGVLVELVLVLVVVGKTEPGKVRVVFGIENPPKPVVEDGAAIVENPKGGGSIAVRAQSTGFKDIELAYPGLARPRRR